MDGTNCNGSDLGLLSLLIGHLFQIRFNPSSTKPNAKEPNSKEMLPIYMPINCFQWSIPKFNISIGCSVLNMFMITGWCQRISPIFTLGHKQRGLAELGLPWSCYCTSKLYTWPAPSLRLVVTNGPGGLCPRLCSLGDCTLGECF